MFVGQIMLIQAHTLTRNKCVVNSKEMHARKSQLIKLTIEVISAISTRHSKWIISKVVLRGVNALQVMKD